MKNTRKVLILILCLMTTLLLSSCHVNKDPWTHNDSTEQTQQDIPKFEGTAPSQPIVEETQQPGGSEDPGING